jgi:hypothetical protein
MPADPFSYTSDDLLTMLDGLLAQTSDRAWWDPAAMVAQAPSGRSRDLGRWQFVHHVGAPAVEGLGQAALTQALTGGLMASGMAAKMPSPVL